MTKMKIAFVIAGNYNTSLYSVTQATVQYLRGRGHQVDLIFLEWFADDLRDNDQYIDIKGMSSNSLRSFKGIPFRLLKNLLSRHIYHYFLSRYFCRQVEPLFAGYDSIFVHSVLCIPLHALCLPFYGVLHSCKADNFLGRRSRLTRKLYQKIYQKVYSGKRLLCVSESAKQDMLNNMQATPKSIETIFNGFNFDELIDKANQGQTEKVPEHFIMAAGRPDRTKRFDILLRAYAKTQQTLPLVIFGEGRKLKDLQQLAIQLGIKDKVIFWGFCDNLLPYFKQASLYVLSSDVEALPTVVIESLMLGTPVVATDAGGVRELLGERLQEWIVPRQDIDQLAEKIDAILANPPTVGIEDIHFLDYREVGKKYEQLSEKMRDGFS
ncbi:glycosyltransferase [Vibrio sp. 11986-1-5]|uniref:glycosyltransferase n=1 Tax=Vibrio sp. 11986-1-5 TaxID=2211215 RepID=UPI00215A3D12|nr:glycosyltransferase [Vibrio sp. 11986-1-5]